MRAGVTSMPFSASRAKVSGLGCAISTPRMASGSTTMMAPPAVVVSTATRGGRAPTGRIGVRRTSGSASISAFEAFDPRDAAIGEERARHIVLAGKRAGVGDGKLARRRRAAELVGDDRLAARRGPEREVAQRGRIADRFEEQQVAVDVGIVERRGANLADREIDLVADRDEAGKADALRPCRATSARRSWCRNARRRRCGRPECPARRRPRWR